MTDHRVCITATFACDDRSVEVAQKVLDRLMDLPHTLDSISWTAYDLEEEDSDG